ncbi:sugar transferase [Aquibium sp. A9E412]|uniref:sugar transferase n=1 Tax=Aquibium sp. A9E412 TaxID=2976767 RepID=UPI0025B01C84|nr:sugar transferase [Aquibium sp. A9E412]MDN2566848.1 sugar transferase [Aquibium sp. A9E412]
MKRAFDLVAAAAGLALAAPLIAVLVLLVRLESPGPGLFVQTRVGRAGRPFRCRKLRTMRAGTAAVPTHEAPADAVTRLGRMLRRSKLDELPQLWNVLVGEMSFVGPRPSLTSQGVLIAERRRRGVLALRPGITGLAQVHGIDMSDPRRLAEVDARYLAERSLALDLRILAATLFGGRAPGLRPSCEPVPPAGRRPGADAR